MSECQVSVGNGINQIFPVTSQDKPQKGKKDGLLYSNLLNVICDAIQLESNDGVLYLSWEPIPDFRLTCGEDNVFLRILGVWGVHIIFVYTSPL